MSKYASLFSFLLMITASLGNAMQNPAAANNNPQSQTVSESSAMMRCNLCGYPYWRNSSLSNHLLKEHPNSRVFKCTYKECKECGDKLFTHAELQANILKHLQKEKPHQCSQCFVRFETKEQFDKHSHPLTRTPIKTKNAPTAAAASTSQAPHNERKYAECPVCYFIARSRSGFLTHIKTQHSNDKVFKCENKECADKLFIPAELHRHYMEHTINRTNVAYKHLCTVPGCFKIFREESQLNEHIEWHKEQQRFPTNLITMEKSSAAAAASASHAQKNKRKNKTTPSARPTKRNKPSVLVPTPSTLSTAAAAPAPLTALSSQKDDDLKPLTGQELDSLIALQNQAKPQEIENCEDGLTALTQTELDKLISQSNQSTEH